MPKPKTGLNNRLTGDIRYISQLFTVKEEEAVLHEATFQKLERILKSYGSRYTVKEVGPHLWGPWMTPSCPEFVLVDTMHPTGPPAGTKLLSMPQAYNPSSIARTLKRAGFNGGFEVRPIEPEAITNTKPTAIETPPRRASLAAWPDYVPAERAGFVPSVRLVVDATPNTLPFTLTLPDPTHGPRIQLWSILKQQREFLELLSVLIIWARSWEMDELTPTVLAYLVFRFLQDITTGKAFSARQPAVAPPRYSAFVNRLKEARKYGLEFNGTLFCAPHRDKRTRPELFDPDPVATQVNAQVQMGVTDAVVRTGKLLVLFFRDQMDKQADFYLKRKESISSAQPVQRLWSPRQVEEVPPGAPAGRPDEPFAQEPRHWSRTAMVCVDPFFPHLNQAEAVSWDTIQCLRFHAGRAYTSLSTRRPLTTIFGPRLTTMLTRPAAQAASYHSNARASGNLTPHSVPVHRRPLPAKSSIDRKRSQTVQRVYSVIERRYGLGYRVELFGSVRYGVSRDNSDLDLAIVDTKRMDGFPPSVNLKQLPEVYNVRGLATTLQKAGFKIERIIPFATVPIVKFVDPETGLHCDINVNDQLGIINSNLIRHYCDLFPPLREMLNKIKAWAKPIGLNDPSGEAGLGRTFSSYSLALMTIGFLQSRGMLPNLQANLDNTLKGREDEEAVFWIRKSTTRIRCDVRYHRSILWTPPPNIPSVQVLLYEWFRYWAEQFDYETMEINIRLGGTVPLGSNSRKAQKEKSAMVAQEFPGDEEEMSESESGSESEEDSEEDDGQNTGKGRAGEKELPRLKLVVMDPFILSKDCTKGINTRDLNRFKVECQRAVFFATHGSLDDEAFVGDEQVEDQSDDEDIFPRKVNKLTQTKRRSTTNQNKKYGGRGPKTGGGTNRQQIEPIVIRSGIALVQT